MSPCFQNKKCSKQIKIFIKGNRSKQIEMERVKTKAM